MKAAGFFGGTNNYGRHLFNYESFQINNNSLRYDSFGYRV
jgi:hypothetical protein